MGDCELLPHLDDLAFVEVPLIAGLAAPAGEDGPGRVPSEPRLELTMAGEDVLAGEDDHVALTASTAGGRARGSSAAMSGATTAQIEQLVAPAEVRGQQSTAPWPSKPLQLGRPVAHPGQPRTRRCSTACRTRSRRQLFRALYLPRIHLDLPGHRPARFRHPRDRLRAGKWLVEVQVAEALPQSSATTAPSTRTVTVTIGRRVADLPSRTGCGSAAISSRAAACPIDVFWQTGKPPEASGCPIRAFAPYRGRG